MTKTLLEVVHAKEIAGGAAISRYVHDQQLRTLAVKRSEMAQHRRKVLRKEMELQRAQTRKRQRRRKLRSLSPEAGREQQEHVTENAADSESCLSAVEEIAHGASEGLGNPVASDDSGREDSFVPDSLPRRSVMKLTAVKHKTCRAIRMHHLSQARKHMTQEHRAEQLFEIRKREFEAMPEEEQAVLKIAFSKVCAESLCTEEIQDMEGSPKAPNLGRQSVRESYDLIECLNGVGLKGLNAGEKKEIKLICEEVASRGDVNFHIFAFELVPRVRSRLMETRMETMLLEFAAYDEDCNMRLDRRECLRFLAKLCVNMDRGGCAEIKMEFESLFNRLKVVDEEDTDGSLDFDGVQMLIARIREKYERVRCERVKLLVEKTGLSTQLLDEFSEEILLLYEVFSEQAPKSKGGLNAGQALHAVTEYGLMSMDTRPRMQAERLVQEAFGSTPTGVICFARFLVLIRDVRALNKQVAQIELRRRFDSYDKDRSGTLSFAEVSVMFEELGLTPQCREDQEAMKKLLTKVDYDGSGDLDFAEFQDLVQQIAEKLRSGRRRRENLTAKELGFSPKEVAELRESFINLDEGNRARLGLRECRKTLTLLRKDMSAEELLDLFGRIDTDCDGLIDFQGFLYFIKTV